MSGNTYGKIFSVTTYGESHGISVGVIVDGVPSGIPISEEIIQKELDRRRPGQSAIATPRDESDTVEIHSGVFNGVTTGTPLMMQVKNQDQRSKDYSEVKDLFRPGHADFTYHSKYGLRDYRGGGRSSARETIGRVCGGAVAKLVLNKLGVDIKGYVLQVGDIKAEKKDLSVIEKNVVRCADMDAAKKMEEYILEMKEKGDSIGAIVECTVTGVPVGLGEPVFDRLHAEISKAIMSIPAVKGIEFGLGFNAVNTPGSVMGDEITKYGFMTNNAGGTLGGISSGQDIVFRFVVKGVSSIMIPRKSIDVYGNERTVVTKGRHDPCVAPRVVPVAEAMTAMVLADMFMVDRARKDIF